MLSRHRASVPLRYAWRKRVNHSQIEKIVRHSPPSAVSQLAETQLKQIGWQQFVRYLILISAISVHQRQVFVRSG